MSKAGPACYGLVTDSEGRPVDAPGAPHSCRRRPGHAGRRATRSSSPRSTAPAAPNSSSSASPTRSSRGVLRDGERLPSESELAAQPRASRVVTAREALEGMRDKGLVQHPARSRRRQLRHLRPRRRGAACSRRACADTQPHRAARPCAARLRRSPAPRPRSRPTARARTTSRRCSGHRRRAPTSPPRAARAARVGRFQLEVAAVSQSPRLVHEELRLQSRGRALALAVPARAGVP